MKLLIFVNLSKKMVNLRDILGRTQNKWDTVRPNPEGGNRGGLECHKGASFQGWNFGLMGTREASLQVAYGR